jgi:hypothetical protein
MLWCIGSRLIWCLSWTCWEFFLQFEINDLHMNVCMWNSLSNLNKLYRMQTWTKGSSMKVTCKLDLLKNSLYILNKKIERIFNKVQIIPIYVFNYKPKIQCCPSSIKRIMIMKLKYIHYHQWDMEDKVHLLYTLNIQQVKLYCTHMFFKKFLKAQ